MIEDIELLESSKDEIITITYQTSLLKSEIKTKWKLAIENWGHETCKILSNKKDISNSFVYSFLLYFLENDIKDGDILIPCIDSNLKYKGFLLSEQEAHQYSNLVLNNKGKNLLFALKKYMALSNINSNETLDLLHNVRNIENYFSDNKKYFQDLCTKYVAPLTFFLACSGLLATIVSFISGVALDNFDVIKGSGISALTTISLAIITGCLKSAFDTCESYAKDLLGLEQKVLNTPIVTQYNNHRERDIARDGSPYLEEILVTRSLVV